MTSSELIQLLGISEDDILKSILSAFVPLQPGVVRANWKSSSHHGNAAPGTADIWQKFVDADFRCTECGSQRRITLDHIDGNASNHDLANLRVVCYDCNRKLSSKGTLDQDAQLRIYRAFFELRQELNRDPTNNEILKRSGVNQIGGATYLLKFLKTRLDPKTQK